LTGVIFITWIVTARLMDGMDAGPGTPLGGFLWFLTTWIIMMTAMMLPSELRFALVFSQFAHDEQNEENNARLTGLFLSGYLLTWTAYGVLAYVMDLGIRSLAPDFFAWDRQGSLVAGAVIIAAGVYQLTPLKQACLRHCISPMSFFLRRWRSGSLGSLRMGIEHGVLCIGCCWGLMLVLFALGIMSLFWMSMLAALMFAEKVLPWGARLTKPLAVGLVILGLWVAVAPETVPGLMQRTPGSPAMHHQ
jgi:predicted metal-binding membrane protein